MKSIILFLMFIPLLSLILLAINWIFAPHYPYKEKDNVFECGFHSFLGQNRTQFSISFFIFALLFLLFDLEILLVYPYIVSAYFNDIYGLLIMLIFFIVLTLGFAFELGKKALNIESKQQYQIVTAGKANRITRDKIILKFSTFINLISRKKSLLSVNLQICSRPFSSNLPTIFMIYIKKILFILKFFILFISIVVVCLYIIYAIYCLYLSHNLQGLTKMDLSFNIILIFVWICFSTLYTFFFLFYTFYFNKILRNKYIGKFLPTKFASELAIKIKLRDRIKYFFTPKNLIYFFLCLSWTWIPNGIKYILTGSIFNPATLTELIFLSLYISIGFRIISCFFKKINFFSRYNICFIVYTFLIIFCTKWSMLYLTLLIPPILGDFNNGNIVNKFLDYLKQFTKLLEKVSIVNKLKFSNILDSNDRNKSVHKPYQKFWKNNPNLDLNKMGLLKRGQGQPNHIYTISPWKFIPNRPSNHSLGIIDIIKKK